MIANFDKWLNKKRFWNVLRTKGGKCVSMLFGWACDRRMFRVFCIFVCFTYDLFNIDQTYSNVSLNRHWCNPCDHHVHAMNTVNHIDFRASFDMDRILQLLMALSRWSKKGDWHFVSQIMNKYFSQWKPGIVFDIYFCSSTTATHRRAQENVHQQHDEE